MEEIGWFPTETALKQDDWETFKRSALFTDARAFYENLQTSAKTMFGYPANRCEVSMKTQYMLLAHYTSPFSNNCGDIDERGNYAMDSKTVEKRILKLFADKFGMGENFWGYITSGGSESNSCGIALAFAKYPNGVLYYSRSAHYSVEKYAKLYRHVEIPTKGKDVLDTDALFEEILKNYRADGSPANLVLTHGTTQYGECDDVDKIVAFLKKNGIPYYLHLDAALYGGIPNGQTDAPLILNAQARGIHSVCVSLHKYLGFPDVHSAFVAVEKPYGEKIAYIGQRDTTVSGSRSIPAYALLNHVTERLARNDADEYVKNIRFFERLLIERGISFYRAERANIFVVDAPTEAVCKKYQLSCFDDENADGVTEKKAHIIIFPSHGEAEMIALADDLKADIRA